MTKKGFVFNNLVRFSEGSVKPVRTVPPHVLLQSRLTVDGLGPLTYGGREHSDPNVLENWEKLGYVTRMPSGDCRVYGNSDLLSGLGVAVIDIAGDVAVTNPKIMTDKGAHAGMTIGQVKALYGSAFKVVKKTNYGVTQYFGSVKVDDRELMFRVDGPGDAYAPSTPLKDSDKVIEITSQNYLTDVSHGGC